MITDSKSEPPGSSSISHEKGDPIFILGISPRSGTNFLHRLLCLHPDCGSIDHTPIRESFFLKHAHFLSEYVKKVNWQWSHWGDSSNLKHRFSQQLGRAISSFSASLCNEQRVVLKTPSVRGLHLFPEFFPHATLLVIVRDGRSVVTSGMEGFGWGFEAASRYWAKAARTILDHKDVLEKSGQFRLVRYEDLNANSSAELKSILQFLGLKTRLYDFEEALNLPVYGSSFTDDSKKGVRWSPVEKKDDFSPTKRWSDWDSDRHDRFNWLAGRELSSLGYEPVRSDRFVSTRMVSNIGRDVVYRARTDPSRAFRSLKSGIKKALKTWADSRDNRLA